MRRRRRRKSTQVAQAATVLQESGATRLAWTAVDILPLSMPGEMMVINLKLSTEARSSTESWRTSMTLISSRLETWRSTSAFFFTSLFLLLLQRRHGDWHTQQKQLCRSAQPDSGDGGDGDGEEKGRTRRRRRCDMNSSSSIGYSCSLRFGGKSDDWLSGIFKCMLLNFDILWIDFLPYSEAIIECKLANVCALIETDWLTGWLTPDDKPLKLLWSLLTEELSIQWRCSLGLLVAARSPRRSSRAFLLPVSSALG